MILQLAARNLFRNPRRTLAAFLTVALGSGSLFLFKGFNYGITRQFGERVIHSEWGHGQINTAGYRDTLYEKPWEHWIENWDSLAARLRKEPGVAHLFPRIEFFALLSNGKVSVGARGQGIDGAEEAKFFDALNVVEGEMLAAQPDGIMLGSGLARTLGARVGDRITVLGNTIRGSMNAIDLRLVGVFYTGDKSFDDRFFRVPLAQAQTLLDTQKIETVALGLRSRADFPQIAKVIREEFPRFETTPFEVLDKIHYQNSVDWLDSQYSVIRLIILTVVILGIFNTISTAVLERTAEIGNLRANGESRRDVLLLLAAEGSILGAASSAAGLILAALINATLLRSGIKMPAPPGMTRNFLLWIELQPSDILPCFLLAAACAVAATLLAAWRTVNSPIGDSLRSA